MCDMDTNFVKAAYGHPYSPNGDFVINMKLDYRP